MEVIKLLDTKIFSVINYALNNRYLDYLMVFITELGNVVFTYGIGLACLFFRKREIKLLGIFLLAGAFISFEIISFLKSAFKIIRPFGTLEGVRFCIESPGYSFPSGHSCFAFMLATILSLKIKKRIFLYSLATLVAFSRIYLGVHYPSDVIVGAAVGLIVGFVIVWLYNHIESSNRH